MLAKSNCERSGLLPNPRFAWALLGTLADSRDYSSVLWEKAVSEEFGRSYWDAIIKRSLEAPKDLPEDIWRAHLSEVHSELLDRWGVTSEAGLTLKTDLYDEATSAHNPLTLLRQRSEYAIGIDISPEVAVAAKRRMADAGAGEYGTLVCDVRSLPLRSDTFDRVVSTSTLDHFSDKKDITASVSELHRILKPRGTLILSLDNPSNPVVCLRNVLPYRLLKSLGLIPYYMGVTLQKAELIEDLKSSGFKVCDIAFIDHAPRILVVWVGYLLGGIRGKRVKKQFLRLLKLSQYMEKLPSRHLTGYFIAVKVRKE